MSQGMYEAYEPGMGSYPGQQPRSGIPMRLILAAIMVIVSLFTYYSRSVLNPITGVHQHIDLSVQQETALGLQAVPAMERENGGESHDPQKLAVVNRVGRRIIERSDAGQTPYHFDFHLLNNEQVVNAFALPGGQVFMTTGLLDKLSSEGEVAAVLGHEIGHVCAAWRRATRQAAAHSRHGRRRGDRHQRPEPRRRSQRRHRHGDRPTREPQIQPQRRVASRPTWSALYVGSRLRPARCSK